MGYDFGRSGMSQGNGAKYSQPSRPNYGNDMQQQRRNWTPSGGAPGYGQTPATGERQPRSFSGRMAVEPYFNPATGWGSNTTGPTNYDQPQRGFIGAGSGGPPPNQGESMVSPQQYPQAYQQPAVAGNFQRNNQMPAQPQRTLMAPSSAGAPDYFTTDGYIDMERLARTAAPGSYVDINGNINARGVGTTPEWNPNSGQRYARIGG